MLGVGHFSAPFQNLWEAGCFALVGSTLYSGYPVTEITRGSVSEKLPGEKGPGDAA